MWAFDAPIATSAGPSAVSAAHASASTGTPQVGCTTAADSQKVDSGRWISASLT